MDVLFATNFSNEQASAYSERVEILPKANIVRSQVTPTGYDLAVNAATGTTYLNLPNVSPQSGKALTYGCTLEVTGLSGDLNVFGHTDLAVGTYNLCSVIKGGNTYLYKEGRYVGKLTGEFNRFELTSGTLSAILNNVYVVANTSEVQSLSFDFVKLTLSEISNQGWFYNGSSLLESIDKDGTLQAEPNINTNSYKENLILNAGNSEDIVLVESAGYIEQGAEDKYAIYVESTGASTTLRKFRDTPGAVSSVTIKGGQFSLYRGDAPMIAKVKSTGSEEVALLLQRTAQVDWGDGSPIATVPAGVVVRHTYPKGEYTLALYGENVESIRISGSAFLGLTAWGNPGAEHYAFYVPGVSNTKEIEELPPTLPKHITSLQEMFRDREYATDKKWDTSHVTDFRGMLQGTLDGGTFDNLSFASAVNADDFLNSSLMNPSIGHLKPENLVTANRMFKDAINFSTSLSGWYSLGNLEQADEFLYGANAYDSSLEYWCVSKLTSMPTNFANSDATWALPNWGTCSVPVFCNSDSVCYVDWDMAGTPLNAETFISYGEFSELVDMQSTGTLNTQAGADEWLNMIIDGQEVVFSKVPVRYALSYQQIYEKGLVFGMPGNGPYTIGTATNQEVKVVIDGTEYLVRLFSGIDDMRGTWYGAATGTDLVGTQRSEWSRLLLPLINEPSAYVDAKLADFSQVDLGIGTGISNGRRSWVMERSGTSTTRLYRGDTSAPYLGSGANTTASGVLGWRVMLVKLRSVFPPEDLFYTTDYVKAPIIIDSYYKD